MAINSAIVSGLLLVLATLSTVSAQCCDFSSTSNCSWEVVQWKQAPPTVPSTSPYYPGFYPTPDLNYIWIQDKSGTMSSTTSFSVTSTASGFSFDYYFSTSDPRIGNYLQVIFINSVTRVSTVIVTIVDPNYGWRHYTHVCDSRVGYCCGSLEDLPCTGTIEIVSTVNDIYNQALFGIDNFCGDAIVTTVQPSTVVPSSLPPPEPYMCCLFQSNICEFYSEGTPHWFWSEQSKPPFSPPPFDGSDGVYVWANFAGATLQVDIPIGITPDMYFSVEYYIGHPNVGISVTFSEVGGHSIRTLITLSYSTGQWQFAIIRSTDWCTVTPCTGTISFEVFGNSDFVVAIDNADINGHCHNLLPCCFFDDPYFCGLVPVPPPTSYAWQWSAIRYPDFAVPPPRSSSPFIYFETSGYTGSAYTATLQSPMIEIGNQAKFTVNFYVYTPVGSDALYINFREKNTGEVTRMFTAKETGSGWISFEIFCNSVHGDCCQGYAPSCSGYLELTAFVDDYGGTVFYGIDSLEIDDKCFPFFPGKVISPRYENATRV